MMAWIGAVTFGGLVVTGLQLWGATRTVRAIWQAFDEGRPGVKPHLSLIRRPWCGDRHGVCRCGLPAGHLSPHECDALACEEPTW